MVNKRILVIEDEDATRFLCEVLLRKENYEVVLAADCSAGLLALAQKRFDLVLLDLNLPDGDGLDFARKLTERRDSVPILMMTVRNRPEERLIGFESGAVDYLVKPFHPGELLHRVRYALSHKPQNSPTRNREVKTSYRFGSWLLDLESRLFAAADGRRIELTRGEFDLLAQLALREGRVIDRYELLDIVTRGETEGHPRTVDVLVSRVRRKIDREPDNPVKIMAAPGIGYRLVISQ
jgi:DNA-binding response OmpR family regulator